VRSVNELVIEKDY